MAQTARESMAKSDTGDIHMSSIHGTSDKDDTHSIQIGQEEKTGSHDNGVKYPEGFHLTLVILALCLAIFLLALDNTIIATATPKVTDHFKAIGDVAWYGAAYLLALASFQLLFGKFYTFFSVKWVFLVAIGIFELGSLVCGVAPTSNALIVGRAIAGLGGAGIFSGALFIIAYSVPLRKRPIYTGIVGSMYGIASVAGPLLGGVFTDKVSWRWCFYINLPIGAITFVGIAIFFKSPARAAISSLGFKERAKRFDIYGTIVFMPGIVCFLLAHQWGGTRYPWSDGRIIALFVVFGVLISAFIVIQIWKQEDATVPPRIIKMRSIWAVVWFSFALGSAFFLLVFYLPVWFQAIKGVSAVKSGIESLPLILSLVILSIVAGGLITKFGHYVPFMIASSVFASIGAGLITLFRVNTGHAEWIGFQVVFGAGVGMGLQQSLIVAQTVLDLNDVPTGTATVVFAQTFGGALFLSIAQTVFSNKLLSGLKALVPGLDPHVVLSTGATSLASAITAINPAFLAGTLEAYNEALISAFRVSIAMACLSLFGALALEWRSVKGVVKKDSS